MSPVDDLNRCYELVKSWPSFQPEHKMHPKLTLSVGDRCGVDCERCQKHVTCKRRRIQKMTESLMRWDLETGKCIYKNKKK